MKVKIFDGFYGDVEEDINNFIKDKEVLDIRYSRNRTQSSALIMYEEKE